MPNPTSVRFTETELALIRTWQERLEAKTGRRHTPSDAIRYLLRAAKPSDKLGAEERAFRDAYAAAFPPETP